MNCTELVLRHIDKHPDKIALWHPTFGSTRFGDLETIAGKSQQLARSIGLNPGDKILLMVGLSPELYGCITGFLAYGLSVILVEPWMPVKKIEEAVSRIQPAAFLASRIGQAWGIRVPAVRQISRWIALNELKKQAVLELEVRSVDDNHAAIITFTSGTTGQPKGVLRTHSYLIEQHRILTDSFGYQDLKGADLCIFANFALANLASGRASLLIPPNWNDKYLKKLHELPKELQAESLSTGPAFLHELIKIGMPASLQHVHVGGALIDIPLLEKGLTQLPHADWSVVYGSTEAEPVAIANAKESIGNSRERGYFQALFLGKAVAAIDYQVRNGSLWVAGPHVCPKYIGNEADNQKNKFLDASGVIWHNMGDRIEIHEGQLWYQGRAQQDHEEFLLEQKIYAAMHSSSGFIHAQGHHEKILYWQGIPPQTETIKPFPEIKQVKATVIVRDRRHRARIDREKSQNLRRPAMNVWMTFIKERLPLFVYSLISGGIALSAPLLAGFDLKWPAVFSSYIGTMVFLILLRLMDEVKDYHKDVVANPTRPLPRGLLTISQVKPVIRLGLAFMTGFAISVTFTVNIFAGLIYGILLLHIWLMYHEFFIGKWLEARPLLYAISHQLSLLWLCTYPIALLSPPELKNPATWWFGVLILGAFFSYEVGRKLDPTAHPVLKTYREVYGLRGAWLIILACNLLAALAAFKLDILHLVFPVQLLTVLSFIFVAKGKHQIGELAASLSLLWHLWIVPIRTLISVMGGN
ncbi:MAG: AMP-binding protein [Oligoflexus sp.]